MTTDSNPKQTLVFLFSEKAAKNYETYNVRLRNGRIVSYNMVLENNGDLPEGRKIIPYFHDGKVAAEVARSEIALTRGSNLLPVFGQMVRAEDDAKSSPLRRGSQAAGQPIPRQAHPINPTHF